MISEVSNIHQIFQDEWLPSLLLAYWGFCCMYLWKIWSSKRSMVSIGGRNEGQKVVFDVRRKSDCRCS